MQDIKTCSKCGQSQHISEFRLYNEKYLSKKCKKCDNEYRREYHRNYRKENFERILKNRRKSKNREYKREYDREYCNKNSERISERGREYRNTIIGKCRQLVNAAKVRSGRKNLEYNINADVIYVMIMEQKQKCVQTGVKFTFDNKGDGSVNLKSPSLDRKDSSKGYTIENIQITCWFYNAGKGSSSDEEVWKLLNETFKNKGFK